VALQLPAERRGLLGSPDPGRDGLGSHGGAPFDLRSKGYVGASSSGLLRQLVEAGQIAPEDGLG